MVRRSNDETAAVLSLVQYSRPSSSGMKRAAPGDYFNDLGYQQAALRTVNEFLKEKVGPVERLTARNTSAKEISMILLDLMARLDYPTNELDEDLPVLLKQLNSPFTVTKSMLKEPGNPQLDKGSCVSSMEIVHCNTDNWQDRYLA